MNELSKNLMCVQMRSGVEIWVEAEKATILQNILEKISGSKFINFQDQTFNTADIVGIFNASSMENLTRRKNKQYQCAQGKWHDSNEKCDCSSASDRDIIKRREEAIQNCKVCAEWYPGWLRSPDGSVTHCVCWKDIA